MTTILKIKKNMVSVTTSCSILNHIHFMFVKLLFPHIYFLWIWNPKYFYKRAGYLKLSFIAELKYIPYWLNIISLTTCFYQVQMILVFLSTVNAEGKCLPKSYSSPQKQKWSYFQSLFNTPWGEYWTCLWLWIYHTFNSPIYSEREKIILINTKKYLPPVW